MTKPSILLFGAGIVVGMIALILGSLIAVYYGLGWGIAAMVGVLLAALCFVAMPLLNNIEAKAAEAISLFLWAEKNRIQHGDPSAPDGTYRGTALSLIWTNRHAWTLDEKITVLRELRATGSASGRNPEDGQGFVIFTDPMRPD